MIVCACQNITLDDIVDLVEKYDNNEEVIKAKADIGKGCEECLDPACETVDLPFPYALINAESILKQRRNT